MPFKQRVLSGVQPTGNLHLGNYLGAVTKFVDLQTNYDCIYCVDDMHSITVWQDPKELPRATREVTAAFIAAGIDPKKNVVFNQSQVAEHAELGLLQERDRAPGGEIVPAQHPQEGALAGAVGAHHAVAGAGVQLQGDPLEQGPAAEALGEAGERDHRPCIWPATSGPSTKTWRQLKCWRGRFPTGRRPRICNVFEE